MTAGWVAGTHRIVVEGASCDGHGICALRFPERLSLDEWGYVHVDGSPIGGDSLLAKARHAVAACPARALSLVELDSRRAGAGWVAEPAAEPLPSPMQRTDLRSERDYMR